MGGSIDPRTRMGPVYLTVTDLERSIGFYQRSLGFELYRREGKDAVLGTRRRQGGVPGPVGNPLVHLHEVREAQRIARTSGLYHFAVLVPNRLELAQVLRRIAQTETPVQGFANHLVSESIYLPDPDGNGIEIYADRPRSEWFDEQGKLRMATDPLDLDGLIDELEGHDDAWPGLDPMTVMGHVHLHVGDVRSAEGFYTAGLGMDLTMRYGPTASFVSAGGYHHHIAFNTWAGRGAPPPPPDSVGLRWYSVLLPEENQLGQQADRLRRAGVDFENREDGLLIRDPSQNAVLITLEEAVKEGALPM